MYKYEFQLFESCKLLDSHLFSVSLVDYDPLIYVLDLLKRDQFAIIIIILREFSLNMEGLDSHGCISALVELLPTFACMRKLAH